MANRVKYKFYLRPDQVAKSGGFNIYLYANINGKKIYSSIGHEVPGKFWNSNDQIVKNGFKNTTIINQRITSIKKELLQIILRADATAKIITVDDFKAVLRNPLKHDDFIDYIQQKTDSEAAAGKISYQTKCNYLTLVKNLRAIKTRIPFDQITIQLWNEIEKKSIASGHSNNTIFKNLVDIRSFINRAIKDGILTVNPWLNIQVKKEKTRREFLTLDEIEKLEAYFAKTTDKNEKKALSAFLFGCYTGLRFSDIKKLQWTNLIDGWILFTTKKTKTEEKNPINQPALKILNGQDKTKDNIFSINNRVTNLVLKNVIQAAKINKKITFHCSRHTFATVSLLLSKDIATISKLLGHSSISTTQIYAQIIDESKLSVVNLWNKKPGTEVV